MIHSSTQCFAPRIRNHQRPAFHGGLECIVNAKCCSLMKSQHCMFVMYNVLSSLAACGRLGVAARPACLFGTRPVARDQRHASHVGATPAD